jgi:hypothetical protein
MNIKSALKAAAVAATLIFAGSSHAAITYGPAEATFVIDAEDTKLLNPLAPGVQFVEVYNVQGSTLAADILAFCIQPNVTQHPFTTYTQNSNINLSTWFADDNDYGTLVGRSALVKKLFESSYASLSGGSDDENSINRLGFALALWDVVADDGNIFSGDHQAFSVGLENAVVQTADAMLHAAPGTTHYSYTVFTGTSSSGLSQNLISVSAVPEADTWAMMLVGLGMVGFMGRRKSEKSAKFDA